MSAWVAMVRGINVGGHRRLAMADLRALFEGLGHGNVRTYIQSGNVVFTSAGDDPADVAAAVEAAIAAEAGLDVAVIVRTADELAAVVAGNPFLAAGAAPEALHVDFMDAEPAVDLAALDLPDAGDDEFRIVGREIFLHLPAGIGRTKLNLDFWEKRTGLRGTARNWRTVTTLAAMAGGAGAEP